MPTASEILKKKELENTKNVKAVPRVTASQILQSRPSVEPAQEKSPGFLRNVGSLAKEIVLAPARAVAAPFAIFSEGVRGLTGAKKTGAEEKIKKFALGEAEFGTKEMAGTAAQRALDVAALLPLGTAVKAGGAVARGGAREIAEQVATKGIGSVAKKAAKEAAPSALFGGAYGATEAIRQDQSLPEALKTIGVSTAFGAIAPTVLTGGIKTGLKASEILGRGASKALTGAATRLERYAGKEIAEKANPLLAQVEERFAKPSVAKRAASATAQVIRGVQEAPSFIATKFYDRLHPVNKSINQAVEEGYITQEAGEEIKRMVAMQKPRAFGQSEFELRKFFPQLERGADDKMLNNTRALLQGYDNLDRIARGQKVSGGLTREQLQSSIDDILRVMTPEERAGVNKNIALYRNEIGSSLDSLVREGILSADDAVRMKNAYPNYIPHYIIDEEVEKKLPYILGGQEKGAIYKTKGGTEAAIKDPIEALVEYKVKNQSLIEQNRARRAYVDALSKTETGAITLETAEQVAQRRGIIKNLSELKGKLGEIVSERSTVNKELRNSLARNDINYKQFVDEVGEQLTDLDTLANDVNDALQEAISRGLPKSKIAALERRVKLINDQADLLATIDDYKTYKKVLDFSVKENRAIAREIRDELPKLKKLDLPEGYKEIKVYKDGVDERYAVPEVIGDVLSNLDSQGARTVSSLLSRWDRGKILTVPARVTRTFATSKNPTFALFRNVIRDFQTAYANAGVTLPRMFNGLVASIGGKKSKYNEIWEQAAKEGAFIGNIFTESKTTDDIVKELIGKGKKWSPGETLKDVGTLSFVERAGKKFEEATRFAVFSKTLDEQLAKGITKKEALKIAASEARNATIDFNKMGSWMRPINQVIPFLNARVQGFANMLKRIKANPEAFSQAAMISAVYPATVLNAHNRQYKSYDYIPEYEKRSFWIIITGEHIGRDITGKPIPVPHYIKIPKGEVQIPIAGITDRIIDAGNNVDQESTSEFLKGIISSLSPVQPDLSMFGTGLTPFELMYNKSFFTKQPIEPERVYIRGKGMVEREAIPKERREKLTTTETAKGIAKTPVGRILSPAQIDFLISKFGVATDLSVLPEALGYKAYPKDRTKQREVDNLFEQLSNLPFLKNVIGTKNYQKFLDEKEKKQKESQEQLRKTYFK